MYNLNCSVAFLFILFSASASFAEELFIPIASTNIPDSGPAIKDFDIIGIYPGMSKSNAIEILNRQFGATRDQMWPVRRDYLIGRVNVRLTTGPIPWRIFASKSDEVGSENVEIGLSAPFSGHRVLGIQRYISYSPSQNKRSVSGFRSLLEGKYGTPSTTMDESNKVTLCWGYRKDYLTVGSSCSRLNHSFEYGSKHTPYDADQISLALIIEINKDAYDRNSISSVQFTMVDTNQYKLDSMRYDEIFNGEAKRIEGSAPKAGGELPKL